MTRCLILFALAIAAPLYADMAAQDARFRKLPPGRAICPPRALEGMALALARTRPYGTAELVEAKDAPGFEKVLRLTTKKQPENPWDFQTNAKCSVGVKKGEVLLAVFWARATGSGDEAESTFVFELGRPPYTKSVSYRFDCGRAWSKFYVPFLSAIDYEPGDIALHFHGGKARQAMEIGGLRVTSYGGAVTLGQLPYTPLTYKGRADDAPWRKEAADWIEKNRKAQLTIVVHKTSGKLLPWATVRVRQQRHAYGFGSAVAASPLLDSGPDADMYRHVIPGAFNKATIENDLKWPEFERNRQRALDAVKWLREAGIAVRGHTLLWPGWDRLPKDVAALQARPEELRKRILDHVRDEVTAFKGQIAEWDVVNEPVSNTDVQRVLGDGILADAFRLANEIDPQARLFINDYGILSDGGENREHQDGYFRVIRALLDAKAPVHGIGMQGHFNEQLTSPTRIWEILDRFVELKLPIQITEHDINVWDEEVMADYTRDFLTAIFAHPATTGIVTWGFWEKRHWIPNAAPWTAGWQLRSHGRVWYDLVYKKWWTRVNTETGRNGVAKVRGFLGDYIIEVEYGATTKKVPVKLGRGGARVEVEL
ncbi:MAG: endo-1,4-beta-xylanase [Chthoniobacteraceae bacterium]